METQIPLKYLFPWILWKNELQKICVKLKLKLPQFFGKTKFIEKKFPVESNIPASRWLHSRILSKIQYWIGNFFAYQFSEGRFVCVALKRILTPCLHSSSLVPVLWNKENQNWSVFSPCALHCINSWDPRLERSERSRWKRCWSSAAVVAQKR